MAGGLKKEKKAGTTNTRTEICISLRPNGYSRGLLEAFHLRMDWTVPPQAPLVGQQRSTNTSKLGAISGVKALTVPTGHFLGGPDDQRFERLHFSPARRASFVSRVTNRRCSYMAIPLRLSLHTWFTSSARHAPLLCLCLRPPMQSAEKKGAAYLQGVLYTGVLITRPGRS